ncbi:multidrug efflux SMR transporter [Arthrobacter sp. JSM 101049]|uniref:DMT family transporter n=1 Tax=Arthrobacter sp. JSM 101049 TaxID=929097 RepID=UPI00356A82AC
MAWLLLLAAIVSEVGATLSLRMATHGSKRWYVPVAAGYLLAFTCLALTLDAGMGLGVAYGIWAALGVALTAVASRVLFGEALNWIMAVGIALIMGGVLLVETGATH